jgi:hypothetical protein
MPPRHSTRFRKGQGVPRGSPGRRELQTDVSYQARLQVEDHARTTSIRPEGANVRCRSQIPVRDPPEQQSVCSRDRCVWVPSPPFRSRVNALQGTLRTRVRNRKPPSPLWHAVSRARGTVRSPSERAHAPTTRRRRRAAALLIVVRRGNAGSGRSFAFKAILSKRVDCRSPADGGIHPRRRRCREGRAAPLSRRARRLLHPPGEAEHRTSARSSCIADDVNQQRRPRRPGACRAWTVTPSARSCSLTARRPRSAEQQSGIATPHFRVRPAEVVTSASTGSALRGTESPTRACTPVIGCPRSDH